MDVDTFITTLYVLADDFCKVSLDIDIHSGPEATLSRSEVITLAVFSQWWVFRSERGFYSWAKRHLRDAFPSLPDRSQFNRQVRRHRDAIIAFFLMLSQHLHSDHSLFEALDTAGIATRNYKRRGSGWLAGEADIGWCGRLGIYEGFHMLDAVDPDGVITGYAIGPASAKDQTLTDTFLAVRQEPDAMLPSVGEPVQGVYIADRGFEGIEAHARWLEEYGAEVISPRKSDCADAWSRDWRRWLASMRQIVESVHYKLLSVFRLDRERPHHLTGLFARLAAKVALHNFCIYINRLLGRPGLEFAYLVEW